MHLLLAACECWPVNTSHGSLAGADALLRSLDDRVSEFTLPNGLHFMVLERHMNPVASCHTFVNSGAYDEADKQTGADQGNSCSLPCAMPSCRCRLISSCHQGWPTYWSTWRSRAQRELEQQTIGRRPLSWTRSTKVTQHHLGQAAPFCFTSHASTHPCMCTSSEGMTRHLHVPASVGPIGLRMTSIVRHQHLRLQLKGSGMISTPRRCSLRLTGLPVGSLLRPAQHQQLPGQPAAPAGPLSAHPGPG